MIFNTENCEKVLAGKKTMTRRLVKEGDFGEGGDYPTRVFRGNGTLWRRNSIYAVQAGRGKRAVGYIRIISIRKEPLWHIPPQDVVAEGVTDRAEFERVWDSINKRKGTRWQDNPNVWVLRFEEVQHGER